MNQSGSLVAAVRGVTFQALSEPRGPFNAFGWEGFCCGEGMQFPTEKSEWSSGRLPVGWEWSETWKCWSLSHVWLCDPMDCSPPGFSVHGILQARILDWVAISFSRGSSQPRDWTWVSCIAGRFFNCAPFKARPGAGLPVLGKEGACPWYVSE